MPSIGIIGAGNIGRAIATTLARRNIKATIANSRGPASLAALVKEVGPSISAGTRDKAAASDIVFVAVNWRKLPAALAGLPDFGGRIVIDTNNAIEPPSFQPLELGGRTSSEVFADMVPGARVVKGFNHLLAALLAADPAGNGGRRVLFYAGDGADAKREVGALIDGLGFFGIDLGTLAQGGRHFQFPGGALPTLNLVKID